MKPPLSAYISKSQSSALFNRFELTEFEKRILANPKATERDASHFFARFPKFLYMGVGAEIRPESILVDIHDEPIGRVDFFRRNIGSKFWDIVEIKGPQISVIASKDGKHPHVSAKITAAINQAQDYKDHIVENQNARAELLKKGIRVFRPKLIVIAGKGGNEVDEELLQITSDRIIHMGANLITYNDIFEFAKEHYQSYGIIAVPTSFILSEFVKPIENSVFIFIGITGSGKSTIGKLLEKKTGIEFIEGDKYQSQADIAKMQRGESLTEAAHDSRLVILRSIVGDSLKFKRFVAVACSALKEQYRKYITKGDSNARFIYFKGSYGLIRERLMKLPAYDPDHFLSPSERIRLLPGQFYTLEEPKNALVLDIRKTPEELVEELSRVINGGFLEFNNTVTNTFI